VPLTRPPPSNWSAAMMNCHDTFAMMLLFGFSEIMRSAGPDKGGR
jgi:hypothetical protein